MPNYNPNNPRQMTRLREEYDWSRENLKHARRMYKETFRRYGGDRYSENAGIPQTYLLLTKMAFGIFRRHLVAENIRTMVSTPVPDLMPVAENMRLSLDDHLDKMKLAHKVKSLVTGAIGKMGIMWCGLDYLSYGENGETGKVACEYVDFTQWCHDMWARDIHEIYFSGHRKRVSFADALDNPLFDHDAVARLRDITTERWAGTDDTIDDLSGRWGNYGVGDSQFFEFDSVWLPRERIVIGLPCDGPSEMLHEPIEWQGVDSGPYHVLAYDKIPNNVEPSPPSDSMVYLDDLTNSLMRKIAEDAKNAKTVTMYRPGADRDAERVRNARNLDMIETQSPDLLNQLQFNGVTQQTLGAFLQSKQLFSWANSNLDTLGGLTTGADTARQEQQLLQSAGGAVDEMKSITVDVVGDIVEHIAHYLWRDEMFRPHVPRHIPGIGSIGGRFEVEDRQGELEDFRIKIAPYSGAPVTPQSEFNGLTTLLRLAGELMPLAQTGAIDFERTIKHAGRLLNVTVTEDIFNLLDTTQIPGPENQPRTNDETTRNYVRESRSGVTPEAQDQKMLSLVGEDN